MTKSFVERTVNFLKARYAPRGARASFSASGEDLIIKDILHKLRIKEVFYIDIGTHDPVFGNNTYLLYKNGGKGILVEPNAKLCQKIKQKRPHDVCLNAGASGSDGERDFFLFPHRNTRSTFSQEQAREWEISSAEKPIVEKVKVFSLDTIIDTYCHGRIPDVVSIDAEGLDREILSGFSFRPKPKIFCIENQNDEIVPLMQKQGYKLSAHIFQNAIFVDAAL